MGKFQLDVNLLTPNSTFKQECSVVVGVRIRPFNDREKALNAQASTTRSTQDVPNFYLESFSSNIVHYIYVIYIYI